MKRLIYVLVLFTFLCFVPVVRPTVIHADELDDITGELAKLTHDLDQSRKATKPLEEDLNRLRTQLDGIKRRVVTIESDLQVKEKQIDKAEKALDKQQGLIEERIHAHYKNIKKTEASLLDLLVSTDLTTSLQNYFYQKKAADNDKQAIIQIILYIKNIDDARASLNNEKNKLAKAKVTVDEQSQFLSDEVGKAKKYQTELTSKIAALSARQQQLVAAKRGSLGLPTSLGFGALHCTDDRNIDPGFSNAFAFFSYGIPHGVGLNQYGALGRAQAGQNAEQILNTYYANIELKKDYSTDINIQVDGYGSFNIEEYTKRIYEMPESWPLEALKAQAVAARTYALNYTNNGAKSICTSQACQVFKSEPKTGAWAQAVEQTRGWVLLNGGSPITAWYASTSGGYTRSSSDIGWRDTPWTRRVLDADAAVNSFADLQAHAYDRSSACFYAAQGWRNEYNKSAWLKSEEVADIFNVLMLAKADSSTQQHLSQVDKGNPDGVDTWDANRVKQELRNRGKNPYNSVSSISVGADFGSGQTNSVSVSGDAGSNSFSGSEVRDFVNLRAPANISIVSLLWNVERK
jgi:SpoIID/LytB domain protein